MILRCTCQHEGKGLAENGRQDSIHGKGRRVHNKTRKYSGSQPIYRCTVCGKERTAN